MKKMDKSAHKQIEEALSESMLRQAAILDNIPDLAWLKDEEFHFIAVNKPFGLACGVPPVEMVGKTDLDIWPEELAQAYRKDDLEVMLSGKRKSVEERLVNSAGQESWVETIKTPIFNESGKIIGTAGIARDITDRKQAEREVVRLNRLYATLSQISQTIVHAKSSAELYQAVCRIAIDYGQFSLAWVGLVDQATGAVTLVASSDGNSDYLKYLSINLNDPLTGHNATGTAIRTGKIVVDDDIQTDPVMIPWREDPNKNRFCSNVAIPLHLRGETIGSLNLYSHEPRFFSSADELKLLKEIEQGISFALNAMHIEAEHKRVEEAFQETEILFSSFLENSPVYVFFKDKNIRTLRLSSNYEQMLGIPISKTIGKPMNELFPSHLAQKMVADDLQTLKEGKRLDVVEELNGRIYETTKFPIFVGGEPVVLAGFTMDITDRKQTEEKLRQSEQLYRAVVEDLPALICRFRPDGVLTFVNDQYCEYFKKRREDLQGYNFFQFIPENEREGVRQHYLGLTPDRPMVSYEHQVVGIDGALRWQRWIDRALFDAHGQPVEYQSIGEDVTERKLADEALARSEERFEQVTGCAGVWVWEVDSEGLYTYVSPMEETILGYKAEELIGKKHFYDFFAPDVKAALTQASLDIFSRKEVFQNLENPNIHKDGYVVFLETSAIPILDNQGNLLGYRGADRDVSERKKAEEALRLNKERYRTLAQNLPDGALLLYDKELRFIIADGPEIDALGFSRAMLEGNTIQEALSPEFAQLIESNMRRTLAGENMSAVVPYEDRVYQFSYVPLRDSSGEVYLAMIVAMNITQQKRIEDALEESERRLKTALRATKVGVWDWDMRTNKAYWSDENYRVLGLEPGSVESKYENWAKCLHPDDLLAAEAKVTEAVNGKGELNIEFRVIWPDGSIHWINDIGDILVDDNSDQPLGMYGIQMDITERKQMEEQLFAEKERAEITLHSIGDAVITTGVNSLVEYLNPIAENLTGWKLKEAVGQPLTSVFKIFEEGSREPAISPVERCLHEGKVVGLANHSVLISRDGREYSIDDSAAPIRNRQGELIGVVLVFHDVTEERRLSRQVAHDAMHDTLTGLVNRREFENRLERALISTKEHNASHILCYLDLDQFKIVNDAAGHEAGDHLLKQIPRLLEGLYRQRDTFARLGGDEFGLLLENCQLDQALIISNEIKAKIRNFPFIWAGRGFQVGVSIGVVPITAEKESVNQLLSQADIACYSAKDLGRDRIFVYQAENSETTQRHSEILQAARMQEAIFKDQFRLFCQPIVQLTEENGKILQYEVLLRMTDSEQHLVLPGVFIPSAERYGLMPAIDRWVIRETILTMARRDIAGRLININLSGKSLDDETLLEYVLEQLSEFSIPPGQICFEITETAAIFHLRNAQQFIQSFRELGGKIALDDFGSGFSSFRYLKTLPVDYIKIDGSFVSEMLSNPSDLLMVEAITQIARTLGIKVIAEHASNQETIDRLREIGVDLVQGFGIGTPVPVEEAW